MGSTNWILLYFTGGLGSCVGVLVVLYNLVAVVLYLREETEGNSSALALTAWAIGVLAMLLWWAPCVGGVAALLAMTISRIERGRIYRDEAPLAGSTPMRMANTNGSTALILQVGACVTLAASVLLGGG
ncbi:MAG: hypothetical protein ABMA64_13115 [Myxococcota bacterium]|jgi:hypothetical protein